jgi:hypothetical protein
MTLDPVRPNAPNLVTKINVFALTATLTAFNARASFASSREFFLCKPSTPRSSLNSYESRSFSSFSGLVDSSLEFGFGDDVLSSEPLPCPASFSFSVCVRFDLPVGSFALNEVGDPLWNERSASLCGEQRVELFLSLGVPGRSRLERNTSSSTEGTHRV